MQAIVGARLFDGDGMVLPPVVALDGARFAAVVERARCGCDVVKVMVTGGVLTPTFPVWAPQFDRDKLEVVVRTSHELGLPVAAHSSDDGGDATTTGA